MYTEYEYISTSIQTVDVDLVKVTATKCSSVFRHVWWIFSRVVKICGGVFGALPATSLWFGTSPLTVCYCLYYDVNVIRHWWRHINHKQISEQTWFSEGMYNNVDAIMHLWRKLTFSVWIARHESCVQRWKEYQIDLTSQLKLWRPNIRRIIDTTIAVIMKNIAVIATLWKDV